MRLKLGKSEAALEDADAALQLSPGYASTSVPCIIHSLVTRCRRSLCRMLHFICRAMGWSASIVMKKPVIRAGRYAKGWFRRAEALQALGRLPEAIAAARRAASHADGAAQLLARLHAAQAARGTGGGPGMLVRAAPCVHMKSRRACEVKRSTDMWLQLLRLAGTFGRDCSARQLLSLAGTNCCNCAACNCSD